MQDSILQKTVKITIWEYFIVFLFIVMCGFTSGDIIPGKSWILALFGILYFLRKKKRQSLFPLIVLIICYIIIGIAHQKLFNYYSSRPFITIPILMLAGFYVVDKLAERFKYAYMNIMTILSIFSLIFYIIMRLSGYVPNVDLLNSHPQTYRGIFIFNERMGEIILQRNCGPFWEPGAFAGYIVIVGILFFNELGTLWNTQKKKCVILLITLITTFSTQGYFAFALLIFFYFFKEKISKKLLAGLFSFTLLTIIAFISLDFLQDKVNEQWALASEWETDESLSSATRFTTSLLDWYYIQESPLIGNTENPQIRYRDHATILWIIDNYGGYGTGSGTTSFMAAYGIPLFLLWCIFTYKSLQRKHSVKVSFMILDMYLILGIGELYFNYIYYISLPFMIYTHKNRVSIC